MYYENIVKTIRESKEQSFICEMINGDIREIELDILEDSFSPVPVYRGTDFVLPWFIARDIISITPKSKYRW